MTELPGVARVTRRIGAMLGARPGPAWWMLALLVAVVLVSFGLRLAVDVPNVVGGTVPGPDAFEQRYVLHPLAAYAHIVPGVVYLLGAPLQLSHRFRSRHLRVHRRLGRVVLAAGLIAGVAAIVVGVWFPTGARSKPAPRSCSVPGSSSHLCSPTAPCAAVTSPGTGTS